MKSIRCLALAAVLLGLALGDPARAVPVAAATSPPPPSAPQGDVEVTAVLQSGVLKLGDSTKLVVIAENTREGRITEVPDVDGLVIGQPGRPMLNESSSFSGGRVTRYVRLQWALELKPEREGRFTIPPLAIEVRGRRYLTPPQTLTVVEDLRGEELGFFEIETSGTRVVEGQPFSIELRFGWDQGIANKINSAELSLPWWGQLPGTIELEEERSLAGRTVNLNLNGGSRVIEVEEIAPETVRGKPFRTFRLRRSFLAARAGQLTFPGSSLEFSRVTESGSFLSPRTKKAETYFVLHPELTLDVLPLPEEGRPYDFTGAVGRIEARADADTRDVLAGESIKLTVEWTGQGNLEFFELPDPSRMDSFEGLRVYGSNVIAKGPSFKRAVFDIAPLDADVTEIPPIPLRVFDPELDRYTTVETRPIPIRVRALENAASLDAEDREKGPAGDVGDIDSRPLSGEPGSTADGADEVVSSLPIWAGLAGVLALWVFLRTWVRRRLGDPSAPLERQRRAARRRLARELQGASGPDDKLRALQGFLAARTREPEQAWVGRDVRSWLVAEAPELAPDDGAELEAVVRELETAVYANRNGDAPRVGDGQILGVADRLLRGGL